MIGPITEPPKLDLERYADWKQIVRFWSDVHGDSPGSQLVAKLALPSGEALNILLTNYLRDSAARSDSRCLDEVLTLTDKEFARPAQESTLIALSQMMSIHRNPNGDLRLFWIRFSKLQGRLELNNAAFPPTALFSRELDALKLSSLNRSMILTAMDSRAKDPSTVDLMEVPIRLFQSFGETNTVLLEKAIRHVAEKVARSHGGANKSKC